VKGAFVIEPLGTTHDRGGFRCGVPPLDRYLKEQVSQDIKRLIASCFVAVESETKTLAGYYTLAATSVQTSDLPTELLKKLPRYATLPAALLGRLAIDQRFHRQGLGSALLADAALRVIKGDVKAFALVVDAKDDAAAAFYRYLGFIPFTSRERSLFLPLATMKKGVLPSG
jgi:ribosomal protein S18 acetylase RimI-like enzyme